MSRFVIILITALLALVGCGDGAGDSSDGQTDSQEPSGDVDIVDLCAGRHFQDLASTDPPVPGFVDCLRDLGAPQDVIDAWTGN